MIKPIRLPVIAMMIVLLSGCAQISGFSPSKIDGMKKPVESPAQTETQPSSGANAPDVMQKPVETPSPGNRIPSSSQPSQTETTLKFAQAFSSMTIEAQKKEIARLAKDKSESARLQLALALSHPANRLRDVPRALALLDEQPKDVGLRDLASLLKSFLADRKQYEETLQQSAQRIKDEQRRADTLQQKLEDLMNLEKAMNRNQPK
jgi:hypothetical protein